MGTGMEDVAAPPSCAGDPDDEGGDGRAISRQGGSLRKKLDDHLFALFHREVPAELDDPFCDDPLEELEKMSRGER